jgi:hypothetical protein
MSSNKHTVQYGIVYSGATILGATILNAAVTACFVRTAGAGRQKKQAASEALAGYRANLRAGRAHRLGLRFHPRPGACASRLALGGHSPATVKFITIAMCEMARYGTAGPAEALRRAMLAQIGKGEDRQAHPACWAPFVVVREGARRRGDGKALI